MAGGRGGGSLLIVARSYAHTGSITADGADGYNDGGGGGGGGICVATTNIKANIGSYSVKGGRSLKEQPGGENADSDTGAPGEDGVQYLFNLGGAL